MAVNKNFVVKNGLEVATDVILANATSKNVGIGSTQPAFTLDVRGGIGATDVKVSGFTTLAQDLQVGTSGSVFYVSDSNNNVGVGTSVPNPIYTLDVRSPVSTGQTALYVYGDMRVTGDINLDDITLDDASIQNLTVTDTLHVTGLTTFVGYTTFSDYVFIQDGLNVTGAGITADTLNVLGVSTFVGFSTFNDYVTIQDGLNVLGNGSTTTTLNVSGVSTFVGFSTFNDYVFIQDGLNVAGVVTATTFVGDGQIGVGSEGSFVGTAATMIDFKSSNGLNTVDLSSGIATVTVQTGASIGLVIALGG
tara:strand:- start:39 stop:956 length:918 start_codon:yes stop_codon:yes gene_type:complete